MQQRTRARLLPHPPRTRSRQAKQNASAMGNNQSSGEASAHGQSTASLPTAAAGNSKLDNPGAGGGGGGGGGRGGAGATGGSAAGAGGAGAGTGDDGVDAGIDLSEEAYGAGADEAGAKMLCAWLNANVATTYIEVCQTAALTSARGSHSTKACHNLLQRTRTLRRFKQTNLAYGGGGVLVRSKASQNER